MSIFASLDDGATRTLVAAFQEYAVVPKDAIQLRRIEKTDATWEEYIGVLGMVGRTAWVGFYAMAKAKKVCRWQIIPELPALG